MRLGLLSGCGLLSKLMPLQSSNRITLFIVNTSMKGKTMQQECIVSPSHSICCAYLRVSQIVDVNTTCQYDAKGRGDLQ